MNQPHLMISYHKLSLGRKVEGKKGPNSPEKDRRMATAPVGGKRRSIRAEMIPPPDDYFHLLFDDKRKPFDY